MRILTTHLTRMKPGFICVAGLDPKDRHVRPVLKRGRLEATLLRAQGGCFDVGALVDLGDVREVGSPPEIEDREFDPRNAGFVKMVDGDELWKRLDRVASPELGAIFGPDLEIEGRGATVPVRKGIASLGVLRPARPPRLHMDGYGNLRLQVSDEMFDLDLRVTDLRLYEPDWTTPDQTAVDALASRLDDADTLVCLGLGRAWAPPDNPPARHWMQVNNIFVNE